MVPGSLRAAASSSSRLAYGARIETATPMGWSPTIATPAMSWSSRQSILRVALRMEAVSDAMARV